MGTHELAELAHGVAEIREDVIPYTSMGEPFDFRLRVPPTPISRWVQAIWYAHGRAEYAEHVLPLSRVVLIVNLGDPHRLISGTTRHRLDTAWIVGQQTRPYLSRVLGVTHAIGVVFEPDGAALFLRIPVSEATDEVVALDESGEDWGTRLRESAAVVRSVEGV